MYFLVISSKFIPSKFAPMLGGGREMVQVENKFIF